MTTVVLVGVASLLAAIAVILVKTCGGKRKKPEKWEKAQILNQLLALSERENLVNGTSHQPSVSRQPARGRASVAKSTSRSRSVRPA